MMENALDTLRTAFPPPELPSPTEEIEGDTDGRTMDYRKYRWELSYFIVVYSNAFLNQFFYVVPQETIPKKSFSITQYARSPS